uniref:NADH-ubiquinone oxidoreductase chain 4L n=1 Tax=Henosepilachna vigintioctopunctata TaxID=420089 RepID=A0A411DAJ0_9CUCU|nr:NADH dehydrogenase subunit 4L [Henosepilachna vigintioctopunctata]QAY82225.1 NADH dehydrogenase subunit 4L [Henosepilachna vigintioctopunctata]
MKMPFLLMFMFLMGLLSFSLKRKHLLMMLLSMEFIILSLLILMFYYFLNFSNEYYFSMIFLSFSVCESALGLSLLVSLIRSHGSDYFYMFNLLW